jgi:hypothetical protein
MPISCRMQVASKWQTTVVVIIFVCFKSYLCKEQFFLVVMAVLLGPGKIVPIQGIQKHTVQLAHNTLHTHCISVCVTSTCAANYHLVLCCMQVLLLNAPTRSSYVTGYVQFSVLTCVDCCLSLQPLHLPSKRNLMMYDVVIFEVRSLQKSLSSTYPAAPWTYWLCFSVEGRRC